MSNKLVPDLVTGSTTLATNSVTAILVNTHCIVCGTAFHSARMGKLYSCGRCKQFGYNHKSEITQLIEAETEQLAPQ